MDHKEYPQDENEMLPLELEFVPAEEELSQEPHVYPLEEEPSYTMEELPVYPQEEPAEPAEEEPDPMDEPLPYPSKEGPFFVEEPSCPDDEGPVYMEESSAQETPADFQEQLPQESAWVTPEIPMVENIFTDEDLAELDPLLAPAKPTVLPAQNEEPEDLQYRDNGAEFDELMNAPAPEKKVPAHKRPTRKGRPKKRGGEGLFGIPNILVTVVWLALIVAIGVTAGRMVWVCAADVLAFGREDRPVTIVVNEGDSMEDITEKLYENGLIRYRSLFNLYASFSHAEEKIGPGFHDLNTRYDYHALVNFMSPSSNRTIVKVMIPEGYTCAQIFNLLEENKVCTAKDIAAYAATGELDEYWFLENVERGESNSLEGFLFPDTYEFYKNDSPRNILQKMLNNFETRFDEDMMLQIGSLNDHLAGLMRKDGRSEEYIADHLFSVREVAIVASLIEKETAHSGESPVIASVIYNRLFNWGGTPAYLNIDASIIYALNGKTDLTRADLQVDSPYNTYLYTGLTPTPISNPGLTSLKAALKPDSTNYYFYVLNPAAGSHQFSTTREEHEAWVSKFASEG